MITRKWKDVWVNQRARTRNTAALLLDRRLVLFLVLDAFVVINALFSALLGVGFDAVFMFVILGPTVILGVPILSGTVALERRCGSLDLALAVPSTERYFLRRVAPVCIFFTLQSWFLVHALALMSGVGDWVDFIVEHPVSTFVMHVQALQASLLVAAVVLFWASRLISSGAVMLSSFLTLIALIPWFALSPLTKVIQPFEGKLFGIPVARIEVGWNLIVVAVTTVIFYLYARERLRRPATMLS